MSVSFKGFTTNFRAALIGFTAPQIVKSRKFSDEYGTQDVMTITKQLIAERTSDGSYSLYEVNIRSSLNRVVAAPEITLQSDQVSLKDARLMIVDFNTSNIQRQNRLSEETAAHLANARALRGQYSHLIYPSANADSLSGGPA